MSASVAETQAAQPSRVSGSGAPLLDCRSDFPIFQQTVRGKPLVYLDSGATTHKPQCVIDRLTRFYSHEYASVRRGVYALAEGATDAFEASRALAAEFLNASSPESIVFVRGCTEGINLVAQAWGRAHLKAGDEVLISAMEHHANIVPWQLLAEDLGFSLKVIPMDERGVLDQAAYERLLSSGQVKLVSIIQVSNALGTINPAAEMARKARAAGALVLLDGAQSAPHMPIDVQALDCDFFTFSGHKVYGPTGVGVLYVKPEVLATMQPYQGGGDMIDVVTFEKTTFKEGFARLEAGTPAIAEVIGLGEALSYLMKLGLEKVAAHEQVLLNYATEQLQQVEGLRIIGTAPDKAAAISFVMEGLHASDIGTLVDLDGVAIRTGHHCAQPVMQFFNVPATARASFGVYNTLADVDTLVTSLKKVRQLSLG
jgi:cysteine desulfurase/selenocysteine lyase